MAKQKFSELSSFRANIINAYRRDETECVQSLLESIQFSSDEIKSIEKNSLLLINEVRKQRLDKGGLDAFLHQFELTSEEGIALMCLAEALLRIPDTETRDQLIKEKITSADWRNNLGKSDSFYVNAATWGLMLTGKILSPGKELKTLSSVLGRFIERTSEPVIRRAVGEAMKIMGKQFILGHTIDEALKRGSKRREMGYRFSYDMLGEAARTAEDADRYMDAYKKAIHAIGQFSNGLGPIKGPGISIKLSALYPRYEFSQADHAVPNLVKRLLELSLLAKQYNMGLTVDAEEADRLDISLDIIEQVFSNAELGDWDGFGLAVQAYQKRAPFVVDYLVALARQQNKRLMVRLVKGAYWDSEIKESQVKGYESYPVYTRKVNTDLSYLCCAKKLIEAGDVIFPQFATHNAQTLSAILFLLGERKAFEFQCLQGMGHALYDRIVGSQEFGYPCRVYAPVGSHEDLLPYLVRRLLENGANTSFVNRIVDEKTPVEELIADPIKQCRELTTKFHPKIPIPSGIYGAERLNSSGIDFSNRKTFKELSDEMNRFSEHQWQVAPFPGEMQAVTEPRDHQKIVGEMVLGTEKNVDDLLTRANAAHFKWNATPIEERAACLERAAQLFEQHRAELMMLLSREAGKTLGDGISEVREAIDFCRYYAEQARKNLMPKELPGPTGEFNQLQMHGRGIVVCISPWNFPLAIFSGQVTAALVAGNCVIAKPAFQTPIIAARAVEFLHQAGVPTDVLQLCTGRGSVVGDALVRDVRVSGIVFTGSTETARRINLELAKRPGPMIPFIAETGGQNAMIADSSALPEQLVMDVMSSAFYSAGQRCSALRVLFIQQDISQKVKTMLAGAMRELRVGDPINIASDIGPVIDFAARQELQKHAERMQQEAKLVYQNDLPKDLEKGSYFAPRAFEIDSLKMLEQENFGPILHIVSYQRDHLDKVIEDINATGYGLTLGIHSRMDSTASYIQQRVHAGNAYVNRNMIGAVVGVQPFGGEGLSGTGPKAGGPHYLLRLCHERTLSINTTASGGNATLLSLEAE